ncbi:MAG: hypothetical protein CL570_05315 [Alphaproteobacteria bacterium]|nr:hypothetical protein [Alphaproteobacteria bacterium]|tara:strand:+ start:21510 stop:22112 length:603 start_codon:yes stop_codon:yes gene_type:complete
MDIDLLFTNEGVAGLICSENLVKKAIGILFDNQTGMMNIEFADMDMLEFNIPIDQTFWETLDFNPTLHIGSVKNGAIGQAYQVPLMFLDDPYRGEKLGSLPPMPKPLAAFNAFVTRCTVGQPVHRDNLDDDSNTNCVLGDASPASLQFAPHLARQHSLEVRPAAAPSAPGFSAPGMGGSTSSGRSTYYNTGDSTDSNGDD